MNSKYGVGYYTPNINPLYSYGHNPQGEINYMRNFNPISPAQGQNVHDLMHGFGLKYGHEDTYGGSAHGGSYGGYEYQPAPQPHPMPPSYPIPVYKSMMSKGKSSALSAITLLSFLYFLNLLQGCLKEHMDTMNPTVMVMTAGVTRRKDNPEFELTSAKRSFDTNENKNNGKRTAVNEKGQNGRNIKTTLKLKRKSALQHRSDGQA